MAAGPLPAQRSRRRPCSLGLLAAVVGTGVALVSTAAAQPPPVTAANFVSAAGGADQYEVMAARVALAESHDARVRAFAEAMVRDHTAAGSALSEAAMRSGLKPPSASVGADQTLLLAALQGLRGAAFDAAYARQQILAHSSALSTEGGYARDGSDPALRAVAMADVPMIEHHLREAQALRSQLEK